MLEADYPDPKDIDLFHTREYFSSDTYFRKEIHLLPQQSVIYSMSQNVDEQKPVEVPTKSFAGPLTALTVAVSLFLATVKNAHEPHAVIPKKHPINPTTITRVVPYEDFIDAPYEVAPVAVPTPNIVLPSPTPPAINP